MPRKVRVCFPGAVYHVMTRANEGARIFHKEKDYELFLEALFQALERFGVTLHAYCLMPNHVHMAIKTPLANLPRFMAWLQTTFTVRYNRNHKRRGHLFQGRYRAEVVGKADYGKWLIQYIHLNPIRSRAGGSLHYVGGWEELNCFTWSSHLYYAGLRVAKKELNQEWLDEWGSDRPKARKAYVKDIKRQIGDQHPLDWKTHVEMGLVAGNEDLLTKVQKILQKTGKGADKVVEKKLLEKSREKCLFKAISEEKDLRNRIWIRVMLLGESQTALAKELGYTSSAAIHQIIKRLNKRSLNDQALKRKIQAWRKAFNVKD